MIALWESDLCHKNINCEVFLTHSSGPRKRAHTGRPVKCNFLNLSEEIQAPCGIIMKDRQNLHVET